jgi:hypothetical protein
MQIDIYHIPARGASRKLLAAPREAGDVPRILK